MILKTYDLDGSSTIGSGVVLPPSADFTKPIIAGFSSIAEVSGSIGSNPTDVGEFFWGGVPDVFALETFVFFTDLRVVAGSLSPPAISSSTNASSR